MSGFLDGGCGVLTLANQRLVSFEIGACHNGRIIGEPQESASGEQITFNLEAGEMKAQLNQKVQCVRLHRMPNGSYRCWFIRAGYEQYGGWLILKPSVEPVELVRRQIGSE